MNTNWPLSHLGEVLRQRKQFITIDDATIYKRPRVQLHAQGIVLRDQVPGALIQTKKQQVCRVGEFLVAEIDAKVGGFGIVPQPLDGAIVSSHYFLYDVNESKLDRRFLDHFIRTSKFREQIEAQGSTNYAAVRPSQVLDYEIPLPPLPQQRQIVSWIEELAGKLNEARALRLSAEDDLAQMLRGAFHRIAEGAPRRRMADIAPIIRRPVNVDLMASYPELGIRSFGKGTFHKPALSGVEIGSKRMYRVEPGDLLFSNVFAWEGGIAVVKAEDSGRFGSHRFIACVPKVEVATSDFLCFYFLTATGLEKIREASPGGAGRNRTLGLDALSGIEVPVPSFAQQRWFTSVLHEADRLRCRQTSTTVELEAVLPSILDRVFNGEL